ncbi:MAG: hypothetical protein DME76_19080 [Verrucomicrobia bacterium]|nr:MAG: hypothetical protein DME76_19080 [Verrucomicrobiota bacterium]
MLGFPGAIANDTNTSVGFNGFNQGVRWIPTSSYFGAFTVEAWVKEKQVRPVETFFNTRTKTGEFSFDFKFDTLAGKEIHFDVGDGTKWLSTSAVPFDFKRNVWYYVAAVVTRRGATYYVDGSAIGSVTYTRSRSARTLDTTVSGSTGQSTKWRFITTRSLPTRSPRTTQPEPETNSSIVPWSVTFCARRSSQRAGRANSKGERTARRSESVRWRT